MCGRVAVVAVVAVARLAAYRRNALRSNGWEAAHYLQVVAAFL